MTGAGTSTESARRWPEPKTKPPLILGHRGASARALENTMAAFVAARQDGADGIELDVRLSRDEEVVVFHDDDLRRLAGRPDRVDSLPWSELRELPLKDDQRMPRLAEVLDATSDMLINVEIKSPPLSLLRSTVRRVVEEIQRAGARDRVLVSSFDIGVVMLVRRTTDLRTGLLFHAEQMLPLRRAWLARAIAPHALHPEEVLVDADVVAMWRRRGFGVNVWTVDDPDQVRRLARLGVDAIITNDPAAARRALP